MLKAAAAAGCDATFTEIKRPFMSLLQPLVEQ
jgi:hypothetical protein